MKKPVMILDGGLGTTLEDVFHKDLATPLWSAQPIEDDPEVIISAHLAFLRSGVDIMSTFTYQCAYQTFERCGLSHADARRIMLQAVKLSLRAKQRFLEERDSEVQGGTSPPRDIKIALSLGPYGATLSPAQEYDGFYPPPFGPDLSSTPSRTNAFQDSDDGVLMERAAIEALAAFHYERLCVFTSDKGAWDALDFIAFETVALRREVVAIRRAVSELQRTHGAAIMKPWWISTVHPRGCCPEMKPDGTRVTTTEIASAALLDDEGVIPLAFGINCTDIHFLPRLLDDVEDVATRSHKIYGRQPWLVLYPNRGDIYHPQNQTWEAVGPEEHLWAENLWSIVEKATRSQIWQGIIVGGCCKTGPEEIEKLHTARKALSW